MDCAVCLEAYSSEHGAGSEDRRPRILPCGHCTCLKCAHNLVQQTKKRKASSNDDSKTNVILCPFDGSEVRIPRDDPDILPVNYGLIEMIDASDRQEQRRKRIRPTPAAPSVCVECQKNPPETFCPACDNDYCKPCADFIHAPRALQHHVPSFLPMSEKPDKQTPLPLCPIHGDPLKMWCRDDNTQICALCVAVGVHKGHSANTIASVAASERKELDELLSVADALKSTLSNERSSAQAAARRVEQNARGLREKIEKHIAGIQKGLDGQKELLFGTIDQRAKRALFKLNAVATIRTRSLDQLQTSISHSRSLLGVSALPPGPSASSSAPKPAPVTTDGPAIPIAAPISVHVPGNEVEADIAVIRARGSLSNQLEEAKAIGRLPSFVRQVDRQIYSSCDADSLKSVSHAMCKWHRERLIDVQLTIPCAGHPDNSGAEEARAGPDAESPPALVAKKSTASPTVPARRPFIGFIPGPSLRPAPPINPVDAIAARKAPSLKAPAAAPPPAPGPAPPPSPAAPRPPAEPSSSSSFSSSAASSSSSSASSSSPPSTAPSASSSPSVAAASGAPVIHVLSSDGRVVPLDSQLHVPGSMVADSAAPAHGADGPHPPIPSPAYPPPFFMMAPASWSWSSGFPYGPSNGL